MPKFVYVKKLTRAWSRDPEHFRRVREQPEETILMRMKMSNAP